MKTWVLGTQQTVRSKLFPNTQQDLLRHRSRHYNDTETPQDLAELTDSWASFPLHIREAINALVQVHEKNKQAQDLGRSIMAARLVISLRWPRRSQIP